LTASVNLPRSLKVNTLMLHGDYFSLFYCCDKQSVLTCVADWSRTVNEGRLMELDGELVLAKVMV